MTDSSAAERWEPHTESELRLALAEGLLDENHHLDLKREIPSGNSHNKELARDLASFAVDGGSLLIGIDEGPPPGLHPVPLAGLPERIESVARMTADPPLMVFTTVIASADDPALGYVVVTVPVSGTAPHMVDNVYYGRGDKVKIRLSDAEVVRLHRAKEDTEQAIGRLLDGYVSRDPLPEQQRAHLFVVAAPVSPRPGLLADVVDDTSRTGLNRILSRASPRPGSSATNTTLGGGDPTVGWRADGIALTRGLREDRRPDDSADGRSWRVDEVEISDEGVVRAFTSDTTVLRRVIGLAEPAEHLLVDQVPGLTRHVLSLAGAISDQAGYHGSWMIGVAATGLGGLMSYSQSLDVVAHARVPRDMAEYRHVTTASTVEIQHAPAAVTGRLVNRLLRVLDHDGAFRVLTR